MPYKKHLFTKFDFENYEYYFIPRIKLDRYEAFKLLLCLKAEAGKKITLKNIQELYSYLEIVKNEETDTYAYAIHTFLNTATNFFRNYKGYVWYDDDSNLSIDEK